MPRQTPEAKAFLKQITALPQGLGVSLDGALQPSLDDEAELRRLFATDKENSRLKDPYVGLVDVFDAPADIRITRARVVKDEQDLSAKYVMPLSEHDRRKEGMPSMVNDLEEFKKNWSIFTEGSLSQLFDWSNVMAAGGAVLACLTPLPDAAKESKRSIRKYYHSAAYPTSDVDLFLWGMSAEQAEKKIIAIYEAVRDSVPWDVTCIRSKHTVSIHSQYPYRSVQIVLRLYTSPAEVVAGFDIDAPSCLYDGERVWANPRAIVAMMRQCNTVDVTRRSPSYEARLAKYSTRAFEVYVPSLRREDVDPTIYERSIARIEGLARLLVLEKLADGDARYQFLDSRRSLRGRPNPLARYHRRKRKYRGDLKAETSMGGLEMNDYDVASLHVPYGPGWDAQRIDKLVYSTDLGMNSTFNPKNKGRRLHRHPAFFGTINECLEDCCENCPKPIDSDEQALQAEEDKQFIRGRISFIEENPGRQSISGSFNPIDVGEWSEQVYIGATEKLFAAIAAHDRERVTSVIKSGVDVNRRDHVGRTPLHVAILCTASDIACALIDAGARMTARLVDGKSSLHLAAQLDQLVVVRKLLERSAVNRELSKMAIGKEDLEVADTSKETERSSSEDDWSSEDDGVISMDSADDEDGDDKDGVDDGNSKGDTDEDKPPKQSFAASEPIDKGDIPEDSVDSPDILDVNLPDWDFGFTPLAHAVLFASVPVIEELIAAGADPKLSNTGHGHGTAFHPLTLTMLRHNEEEACKVAERLILAGASSSTADENMRTIFHRAVSANKTKLVLTILRCDPNVKAILDFPSSGYAITFPVISAIDAGNYSMLAILLAHGAKLVFTEEDASRTITANPMNKRIDLSGFRIQNYLHLAFTPLETAISRRDYIAKLLIALNADSSVGLRQSMGTQSTDYRRTIIDCVRFGITTLSHMASKAKIIPSVVAPVSDVRPTTWKEYHAYLQASKMTSNNNRSTDQETQNLKEVLEYFTDVEHLLTASGAKTWNDIYPDQPSTAKDIIPQNTTTNTLLFQKVTATADLTSSYAYLGASFSAGYVPQHLTTAYDELYEACFAGTNVKVRELCLSRQGSKETIPQLSVYVQIAISNNQVNQTGYTPLFAAVSGRHWDTARLVLAIAGAQHRPKETVVKFKMDRIKLNDDDSDAESEHSDDSDDTVEQDEVKFIDIANIRPDVRTDVHPKRLLDEAYISRYIKIGPKNRTSFLSGNILHKTVEDNDFEAFVNIANLYKVLPVPIPINSKLLDIIIDKDRPDMLDEFIRRTGLGIDVQIVQKDERIVPAINDKNRLYLGLSVHGKKRTDLAKMNDPNATHASTENPVPLLWQASVSGAKGIVEYLSGPRPLAAYNFYATSNNDEQAQQLRRLHQLDKVIPDLLGWKITRFGDSPLTAAVIGKDLDMVKKLFALQPRLLASSLHEHVKFVGYNPLMLAVDSNCPPALIDYLLAKSVSPAETDRIRGWNIYHLACDKNHCVLLEHLLRKLPRDVSEALLAQQSRGRLNTPLHLAVKLGAKRAAKLIVEFTKSTVTYRDVDGSTALHVAVQKGYAEIAEILIEAAPADILYIENGVGETPLEIASLRELLVRIQQFVTSHHRSIGDLGYGNVQPHVQPINLEKLGTELPQLRSTIEQLTRDGRLGANSKLAKELTAFSDMMETKFAEAKLAALERPVPTPEVNPKDVTDHEKTLKHVLKAVLATPGRRQLIHLLDVQKSVQDNLARCSMKNKVRYDDDGLVPEEGSEEKERQASFVLKNIWVGLDGN